MRHVESFSSSNAAEFRTNIPSVISSRKSEARSLKDLYVARIYTITFVPIYFVMMINKDDQYYCLII